MSTEEHPRSAFLTQQLLRTGLPQPQSCGQGGELGPSGTTEGIHQNPRASDWLLKGLQTSKYANSLIQHLSSYLKLDSLLSAFMSGSQDKEGTQQIRSSFPGLKSTATSARPRQQPSSNSCSSFPSYATQGDRATKFAALVTSMLVAPPCQPGPVPLLLSMPLNECIHQ